jgi:hypothetical protein
MFANPGIANRAYHIIPAQGCVMELITHGTHGSVECHKPSEFRAAGGAMSVKQYRRSPCNFHNPEPSPTELAIELVRVKAELRRRLQICDEFRGKGFDDPRYADLTSTLRDPISIPTFDRLLNRELFELPAPLLPYCLEVHRRIRRLAVKRSHWERLVHHEVLLLLASISTQRAINLLLDERIDTEFGELPS